MPKISPIIVRTLMDRARKTSPNTIPSNSKLPKMGEFFKVVYWQNSLSMVLASLGSCPSELVIRCQLQAVDLSLVDWPFCGRFQLHDRFGPLDQIGDQIIYEKIIKIVISSFKVGVEVQSDIEEVKSDLYVSQMNPPARRKVALVTRNLHQGLVECT